MYKITTHSSYKISQTITGLECHMVYNIIIGTFHLHGSNMVSFHNNFQKQYVKSQLSIIYNEIHIQLVIMNF